MDGLQEQKTKSGPTPDSQEHESETTVVTGSAKLAR